jgi:hypothetical protein
MKLEAPPGIEPGMDVLQTKRGSYVVDSCCFLVSGKASFYPAFGRLWIRIGPRFWVAILLGFSTTRINSDPPRTITIVSHLSAELRQSLCAGVETGPL